MWWTSSPSVATFPLSLHTSHIQCASSRTCRLFLFHLDVNLSLSAPVLSCLYVVLFIGQGWPYGCIFPHRGQLLYAPMRFPLSIGNGPRRLDETRFVVLLGCSYTLSAPLASEPTPYCISPSAPKAYHLPPMLSTSAACIAPVSASM